MMKGWKGSLRWPWEQDISNGCSLGFLVFSTGINSWNLFSEDHSLGRMDWHQFKSSKQMLQIPLTSIFVVPFWWFVTITFLRWSLQYPTSPPKLHHFQPSAFPKEATGFVLCTKWWDPKLVFWWHHSSYTPWAYSCPRVPIKFKL